MSSANRVRVSAIVETEYGVLPAAGSFRQIKLISEDFTATPTTTESQELRSDRMTAGQSVVGLEVGGGFDFEASIDPSLHLFIEHALMSSPVVVNNIAAGAYSLDADTGVLTRTAGNFTGINAGDIIVLSGFTGAAAVNNQAVYVVGVQGARLTIAGAGLVTVNNAANVVVRRPVYHQIGSEMKSTTISKEYLDVVGDGDKPKNFVYYGQLVNSLAMNLAFGELITGRVDFRGNGYDDPEDAVTVGRTVIAAGDDDPLKVTEEAFGWMLIDGVDHGICLQNLNFTLSNNISSNGCLGKTVADPVVNSATIAVTATAFLDRAVWELFVPRKVNQIPVSMAYYARDPDGHGYGIVLDRVQATFPDPPSTGRDAQVTMALTGTASYNASTTNMMRIYIL